MSDSRTEHPSRWMVVLSTSMGTEVLPGHRVELLRVPADQGPVDVGLWTRQEEVGLAAPLPRETYMEVVLAAAEVDVALAEAGAVGTGLATMISCCVNAYVPPPEPVLAYEVEPGLQERKFWQRYVPSAETEVRPSRRIDPELLVPFLAASFSSPDAKRIGRATSQYQMALNYWSTRGQPLALAHLYIALEALTPVSERRERERLGLGSEEEHARHRGVDVAKSNWREVLKGWIRRDVLCRGDKKTYDAARRASDGFEHGFMSLPAYRAAATEVTPALLGYVRAGILELLDLDEKVRSSLLSKTPVDTNPLWWQLRGELSGDVADPTLLADPQGHLPYPCVEWRMSLDAAERTSPDQRLRISPRHNMTVRIAPRVRLTPTEHGVGLGLNDGDTLEFQPPASEPTIIEDS